MIRGYLLTVQKRLDALSLRERVIILVLYVVFVFTLWNMLVLNWHESLMKGLQQSISLETQQVNLIKTEVTRIKNALKDPNQQVLLKRYQSLQKKIGLLENGMHSYKQKVISNSEVHQVIYEVLKDIQSVRLVAFISKVENEDEEVDGDKKEKVVKPAVPGFDVTMKEYRLTLKGQYFAVLNYLKLLEKQGWQFYWETFEYLTKDYPDATVIITFHTLVKNDA